MKKKNREIHLRLTDDEYSVMQKKASEYKFLSSMIIDAVYQFDDRLAIRKVDILQALSDRVLNYHGNLAKIGSNINQMAHYANQLALRNESSEIFYKEVVQKIDELSQLIRCTIDNDKKLFSYLVK